MTEDQKIQMNGGYTNGSCLAYWGSIEWLNGASVVTNEPCFCGKCIGEAAAGGIHRRAVRVEWNGFAENLIHVDPKHLS